MPRANTHADDEHDDPADFESDAADWDGPGDDDDLPEMSCPSCGGVVTEDTQKCPLCGDWIKPQSPSTRGWRRWLFVAAVILMLLAILRWAI